LTALRTGAAQPATAGTYDQGRIEQQLTREGVVVREFLQQQVSGGVPDLPLRHPDRTERRKQAVDEQHVIEADHRHVTWTPEAELGERVIAADREAVVGGHYRRDRGVGAQQLRAGPGPLLLGEGTGETDPFGRYGQTRLLHRRHEAEVPPVTGGHVLRAGHVTDARVAEADDVLNRDLTAAPIINRAGGD